VTEYFQKLFARHGGFLCTCFLVQAAKDAGMHHLIPTCQNVVAIADGHLSLAVVSGNLMFVPDDDCVGRVLKKDDYDKTQLAVISRHLRKGDVAIDVGANCGPYTLPMSAMVGDQGKVLAIEPCKYNIGILHKNMRLHRMSNVVAANLAAGDAVGTVNLYYNETNFGDHTILPQKGRRSESCQIWPVDRILQETIPNRPVRLIKLDVQGVEYAVLKGAERTINSNRDCALYVEVWPVGLRAAGVHEEALIDLIASWGYIMHITDNSSRKILRIRTDDLKRSMAANPHEQVLVDLWCVRE